MPVLCNDSSLRTLSASPQALHSVGFLHQENSKYAIGTPKNINLYAKQGRNALPTKTPPADGPREITSAIRLNLLLDEKIKRFMRSDGFG